MRPKYFIFIDETGNNTQEQYLGIGCLLVPVDLIGDYYELLKSSYSKILQVVKDKEAEIIADISGEKLLNFYKGRTGTYEMKFKSINQSTLERYSWLITQYFKLEQVRFCSLVIDKQKYPIPDGMDYFDAYMNQLTMLVKNNVGDSSFVILPDDITVPNQKSYERTLLGNLVTKHNKNCFGVCRIESHSSLFIQMVDILVGSVVYDFKSGTNPYRKAIAQKVARKVGKESLNQSFTTNTPNYFSVWEYARKEK